MSGHQGRFFVFNLVMFIVHMGAWAHMVSSVEIRGQLALVLLLPREFGLEAGLVTSALHTESSSQPCLVLRSHYIAQAGLQISEVYLLPPPECWD